MSVILHKAQNIVKLLCSCNNRKDGKYSQYKDISDRIQNVWNKDNILYLKFELTRKLYLNISMIWKNLNGMLSLINKHLLISQSRKVKWTFVPRQFFLLISGRKFNFSGWQ